MFVISFRNTDKNNLLFVCNHEEWIEPKKTMKNARRGKMRIFGKPNDVELEIKLVDLFYFRWKLFNTIYKNGK